ncbi:ABC transporter permease [Halobacillus salinarum]|uniref:ABC transporter permease n=1 Tax=Halobacillus salinarum TaxID=2932257 RepID=A0ABY4EN69_9BACI|nr:ABC transporter permease [Halobacillus salinarum]UOQ43556.1 ABC transporter permease [Halobacillus salinarum]
MVKTWKLIKTMVKMQFSMAGKRASEKLGLFLVVLIGLPMGIALLYLLNGMISSLYNALAPSGNENVVLALLFVFMSMVYILVSFTSILSSFYFAEDVEAFIALPLQPYQIIAGKSAVPFIQLYGVNTAIVLPSLFMYGNASGSEAAYYVYAFIVWLFLPVLPFVIAAILLMFFMRFANISKNKDRTKVLAGIFSFVFLIVFNVIIRMNMDAGKMSENVASMIHEKNGMLTMITQFFPNAYFGSMGLSEASNWVGLIHLLIYVCLSIVCILIFMTLGQSLYFKGVLGLSGGSRQKSKDLSLKGEGKQRPIVFAALIKELKVIFRTPTFFTQIVIQSLLFPFFLIVVFFMESSSTFNQLGSMVSNYDAKSLLLIMVGFTSLVVGVNPAAITSVSRDGKSWFTHLYLPVSAEAIMFSKVLAAFLLNALSIVIIGVISLVIFHVPFYTWVLWFILSLFISLATSLLGTVVDLYDPKLMWTDEREIFKGRFIGLIVLGVEGMTLGLSLLLLWNISAVKSPSSTALLLLLVLLAISMICFKLLKKLTKEKFFNLLQ